MPFKGVTVNDLRREFVQLAMKEGANISALCRHFGISRTHAYTLIRRAHEQGVDGLDLQPRCPHTSPNQTPAAIEATIVALRKQHPDWGARKLGARLRAQGLSTPVDSTITAILHRNDLVHPPPGGHVGVFQRFERDVPNELWQMDFLGHKPMRKDRVHPLTILDDHSRYGLTLAACANETGSTVWEHLRRCFERYGLPWEILTDNAPPWGHSGFALTRFEIRLIQLGVRLIHGRPYRPETQGKIERWHRSITAAIFGPTRYEDLAHVQDAFDVYRSVYNTERPHEALGLDVPVNHYQASSRPYPTRIEPPHYDDCDVRKVRLSGEIHYQGARYRVSQSLAGEWVGLQPTLIDGHIDVYYYNQRIRTIHLKEEDV